MPPQSRGTPPKPSPLPSGFVSKSTPNLPTLQSLKTTHNRPDLPSSTLHQARAGSPEIITSPSEPASIDDFTLDPTLSSPTSSLDDEASEDDDDEIAPNLPPRPVYHHHSRSHTHLAPSAFAPPFYNRPPTPLPPSPSLTSLLRPTFSSSTATSRPSTPDPSSDEGGQHNHTHPTFPGSTRTSNSTTTPGTAAASTTTLPSASPRVPTYEYYGFTLYLTSSLVFTGYLFWAFLPSPFLAQLGIEYYPNRWWALAIPAWTVMLVVYIYVALACYNIGTLTLGLGSVGALVDEAAEVAVVDARGRIVGGGHGGGRGREKMGAGGGGVEQDLDWKGLWCEGTDAVMDIPIGGVCEILYGSAGPGEDDDGMGDGWQ